MNKVKKSFTDWISSLRKKKKKPLFLFSFYKWHLIGGILIVLFLLIALVLTGIQSYSSAKLKDQRFVNRWTTEHDYAQVSLFFPYGTQLEETDLKGAAYQIEKALSDISKFPEYPSQRLFVTTMYEKGSISILRGENTVTVDAYGVSGDFFLFHPMEFVSGHEIPTDLDATDYVVLDEKTAWNLFGAIDVEGMEVRIGDVAHIIAGVVKTPTDRLSNLGGAKENVVYVTKESLNAYGTTETAMAYELLMPEPFAGFAETTLKTAFSTYEKTGEWVDNSKRFELKNLFQIWKERKARSMQLKPVSYPYWENVARYYETIFMKYMEIRILCYFISAIIAVIELVSIWKMRNFDKEDIKNGWIYMIEAIREQRIANKQNKKEKEEDYYEKL